MRFIRMFSYYLCTFFIFNLRCKFIVLFVTDDDTSDVKLIESIKLVEDINALLIAI